MGITVLADGTISIKPSEGKWLKKGDEYYSGELYLGKFDSPNNYIEVDTAPPPPEEELDPETLITLLEGEIL